MIRDQNGNIDSQFSAKVWDKLNIPRKSLNISPYEIERVLAASQEVIEEPYLPGSTEEALIRCMGLQSKHIHRLIRSLAKIEKALTETNHEADPFYGRLVEAVEDEITELKKEGFVIDLREVREGTK